MAGAAQAAPDKGKRAESMIELTKMNNEKFYVNPNMIEVVEITPDRLITLMSGRKYYVLEPIGEITEKFEQFYRRVNTTKAKKPQDGDRTRR